MGKLKDQMLMEMELRNFSDKTIKAYLGHMVSFTRKFGKSPAELSDAEIRQYLHYLLKERKASWSNINIAYCSLKFFYTKVLHRSWNVDHIPRPKKEKRLPNVLSYLELERLFEVTTNMKHLVIFKTAYASGMRVGELSRLKVSDIDSGRMVIRIDQGKGKKDRYTILSQQLLPGLRSYWREYRPSSWLFFGRDKQRPINTGTIQRVFKTACQKAGIKKPVTPHALRHSFATHFLEEGGNLIKLQQLLGHRYLQTTLTYVHVQNRDFRKVFSPLDCMKEDGSCDQTE
jgi:site-specific recombinase XerD